MTTSISDFTKHNLNEQGFDNLDDAAKSRIVWPLRFTPGLGVSLIAIGLVWQSPIYMGVLALIALSGALLPHGIPDLIYNFGVRHLFRAPPLPPMPKPRRFSYFISTTFLAGSALSFYYGLPVLGIVLGGSVCIAGAVLMTTLWCLGSWIYKLIFGSGSQVISPAKSGL